MGFTVSPGYRDPGQEERVCGCVVGGGVGPLSVFCNEKEGGSKRKRDALVAGLVGKSQCLNEMK